MDDWGGSGVDDKLMLALEEYKTLRQEILNSITAQYAILTFGATESHFLPRRYSEIPVATQTPPRQRARRASSG